MRNKLFSISVFIYCFFSCSIYFTTHAQWNSYTYFNTDLGWGWYTQFDDADFITEQVGMYTHSYYSSPSSGTIMWVRATNDSGNTWNQVYTDQGLYTYPFRLFTSRAHNTFYRISSGWWSGLTKTDDNGLTWKYINLLNSVSFLDLSIVDTSSIFVLSYSSASNSTLYLFHYRNGITTAVDSFVSIVPRLIFFADSSTGYIAAQDSQNSRKHIILKSISSGTNWVEVFDDSLVNVNKMFFVTDELGFLACDSGKVFKTSDGGINWQQLSLNTNFNLSCVYFLNDTVGFVAGENGFIKKTEDGGVVWTQQTLGTLRDVTKLFFVNDSIGFALVGQELFRTNLKSTIGVWEVLNKPIRNLQAYPNPTEEKFTIIIPDEFHHVKIWNLLIMNSYGQTVESRPLNIEGNKTNISLNDKAKGIYFLKLTSDNLSVDGKIILN